MKKKIIYGILSFIFGIFFGGFISFCSADIFSSPLSISFEDGGNCSFGGWSNVTDYDLSGCYAFSPDITNYVLSYTITFKDYGGNVISSSQSSSNYFCVPDGAVSISYSSPSCVNNSSYDWQMFDFGYVVYDSSNSGGGDNSGFSSIVSDKITWLVQNKTDKFYLNSLYYYTLYDIEDSYGTYCIVFDNIDILNNQSSTSFPIPFGFAGASSYNQSSSGVYNGLNQSSVRPSNRYFVYPNQTGQYICIYGNKRFLNIGNSLNTSSTQGYSWISGTITYSIFKLNTLFDESIITSCPSSSINVLYNNQNSTDSIVCDGDNIIQINGLSTLTSTNTFTPYFNIYYRDEDNQLLTESYSKDLLYLSGGNFKKTYSGDNYWVLNNLGIPKDSSFSGYLPTFDVVFTGDTLQDTGNVFNNFAENSLKFTLSNIPSYIQYVIILMILFFILGFIRKFRRK